MADLDPVVAILLVVWLTLFGACLGSFLNVVVYRLPRRKSLSNPPSHCPKCNHPIRWYDNVPVFGWLLLRGKCRDCKEPISVRYPVVEAICGGVFCTISILTLRRGGDASLMEVFWLVTTLSGLVITFFAAGLIEQEDNPIPWRLLIPVAVLAPMMPFLWNDSFHVQLFSKLLQLPEDYKNPGVVPIVLFCIPLFSLFLASLFVWLPDTKQRFFWLLSAVIIGIHLGWLALPVIFISGIALLFICFTPLRKKITPHLILAFSMFLFIVLILSTTAR